MKFIVSPHLVKVKRNPETYVVYHSLFGRATTVAKSLWDLIEQVHGGARLTHEERSAVKSSAYKRVLARFKKMGFLIQEGKDEYAALNRRYAPARRKLESTLASGAVIDQLRLEVTGFCNFRCRYCFAEKLYDWKKQSLMSFETAKLAVDGFLRILRKNGKTRGEITYWGGEPLINWAVIRQTVEYTEKAAKGLPLKLTSGFVTNGSLITDEIAAFMARHSMTATVSLDALGKDNDRLRRYADGRGTFKNIIRGIDILFRHGIPFWVEITLHDYNFHGVEKLVDYLYDKYKVAKFIITPVYHQKSRLVFDRHSAHAKAKRMVEIYKYGVEKNIPIGIEHLHSANAVIKGRPNLFVCNGKAASLYVKPDGRIYPCQKITIPTGDVRHIEKVTSGDSYRYVACRGIDRITTCRGCDIEGFCAGGCAGLAQFYSGDIYDTSDRKFREFHCEYRKHLLKETLKYLSNI